MSHEHIKNYAIYRSKDGTEAALVPNGVDPKKVFLVSRFELVAEFRARSWEEARAYYTAILFD